MTGSSEGDTPHVTLTRLIQYHLTHGDYVDPRNGVWGFPHLYAERWG